MELPNGEPPLRALPPAESRSGRHRQPGESPPSYRDVFAIREFRGLWSAQALWSAGDQFAQVVIAILVYDETGSAFLTALAYALTYLPPIAGGPTLSGLADRFPQHRVMITLNLIRAGLVALMAVQAMPFLGLCGLLLATVVLGPPFAEARTALLLDVLPRDKFVAGSAIGNLTYQLSQVIGFVAGAGLTAAFGPHRALALDALSFCLSAAIIARWVRPRPAPPRETAVRPTPWSVTRASASRIFGNPVLRTLVLFGWLAGFAVVPEGLAAPYARALSGGPLTVGLLMAAMPAGTMAGGFVLGRLARPTSRMRPMGWLAMLSCAPLLISLLHPPLWLVLLLWGLAGAGGAYQLAAGAAFVQALPLSGRARTFGVAQSGLLAAQGLGILVGGAVAQRIGPQAAVALAGLLGLLAAAALATGWTRRRAELITVLGGRAGSAVPEGSAPAMRGHPEPGTTATPATDDLGP